MSIQSSARRFCVASLVMFGAFTCRGWAQTVKEPAPEPAKPPTATPTEAEAAVPVSAGGITNDEIWNLLNSVSDRVDTNIVRATDARDAAQEVRAGVRDGVAALTGELRAAVDGALADLKRIVAEELGGADFVAFTDGPNSCSPSTCEPFRQELLSLVVNFESTANGLFTATQLGQIQLDFQRLRGILENVPGRLLFPLYYVLKMDHGDLLGALSDLLGELNADLGALQDVFVTDGVAAEVAGPGTPICTAMTDAPLAFEIIVIRNTARAIALKLIAKVFDALGETSATADAGVHGYVHITYEENFPKKFAAILESLSDSEFYIAKAVEGKLEFCLMLQVKIDAQQTQLDSLAGQAQVLDAIHGNADFNYDGDINLRDFAVFQRKFGSTTQPRP